MINGLSKWTTNAGKAIDYFLGDDYYEKETEEWKPRDPAPVILEGDPEAMKYICDSLDFKNRYTTGVLSFSPEETARLLANPELKDEILQDFKDFAFAGVPDDARQFLAIEHTHTGRLEIHYMMPRVHLESGKYRNPFPPNYDGKMGKGNNQAFIEENDAYIDHACQRFGLQNPRDPAIARDIKIDKFDPESTSKRDVNKFVNELVSSGHITCREDIEAYLKQAGGTITRSGEDYISVRFADDQKSMKFKGELYGKQSFGAAALSTRELNSGQRPSEESIRQKFENIMERRTEETTRRHGDAEKIINGGEGGDSGTDGIERHAEREFNELASAVEKFESGTNDCADIKSAAVDFASNHREEVTAIHAKGASIPAGGGGGASDVGVIHSDDPVIRFFNNQMRQHVQAQLQREIARSKTGGMWSEPSQADKLQAERNRVVIDAIIGMYTGIDVSRPGARFDRKALTEATAKASDLAQERAQVIEAERQQMIADAVSEKKASSMYERQDEEERARQDRGKRVPSWQRNGHDPLDDDESYKS